MNPIRFFTYLLIIQFAVLSYFINSHVDLASLDTGTQDLATSAEQGKMYDTYRSYLDTLPLSSEQKALTDSIKQVLFQGVRGADSTYIGTGNLNLFSYNSNDYKITAKDAIELTNEELFDKYNIEEFFHRLITVQFIKVYKDRAGTIRLLIANCLWVIVLSIFLLAFVLKILYIRHDIHLVEHIVLLCNAHSLFFIIGIISLGLGAFIEDMDDIAGNIVSLCAIILVFIIMKKHYKQGIFKTFIKYITSLIIYVMIIGFCTVFIGIISFLTA